MTGAGVIGAGESDFVEGATVFGIDEGGGVNEVARYLTHCNDESELVHVRISGHKQLALSLDTKNHFFNHIPHDTRKDSRNVQVSSVARELVRNTNTFVEGQ